MKYAFSILSVDHTLSDADISAILTDLYDILPISDSAIVTQSWLSKDEAYQVILQASEMSKISMIDLIPAFQRFREKYQPKRYDLNLIPFHTSLRKRLLIADMDSTIVTSETLDDLAEFVGLGEKVADITAQAMRGDIDFKGAVRARVAMLADLPESRIDDAIAQLAFTKGAENLVQSMRQNHAYTALVSGGFRHFTNYVADKIGFHENHANQLEIKDAALTGQVIEPIQDKNSKEQILNHLAETHNIDLNDCLTVGDGANDIPMLRRANQGFGLGVGFHAKPTVHEQILPQIIYHDLSALLFLQGYHRDSFVAK